MSKLYSSASDNDLRDMLKELDKDEDIEVSSWEASFIEDIAYKTLGDLTDRQREKIIQILAKYNRKD